MPPKKVKLSPEEKKKQVDEAFENMIENEIDGTPLEENDTFSVDELSDDSESSSELSDPFEEFDMLLKDPERKKKKKKKKIVDNPTTELINYINAVRKKAVRGFIDYGPPYTTKNPGGSLVDECADWKIDHFFIHSLLNNRANPNTPDPRELYFTPMHWCARFCHLLVMKMLYRAQVNIDPVSELGQTPLTLACMFNQPPNRLSTQIKMVKWLVERGANVNHIDKGGFSPLDFAVMNRNVELVTFLLEKNAEVLHLNQRLVMKKKPILTYASDNTTKNLLRTRIEAVERKIRHEKEEKEREERIAEDIRRVKERHQKMLEARKLKQALRTEANERQYLQTLKGFETRKVNEQVAEMSKKSVYDTQKYGNWQRQDLTGNWTWKNESSIVINRESIIPSSRKLMRKLRDKNKMSKFNDRWKAITGQDLEVDWKKWNTFDVEGLDSDGEGGEDSTATDKNDGNISDDLDYKDANDAELEGENLDDLIL